MHRIVLICSAGFLLVSTIPKMTEGSPLSFLMNRVEDDAAIEQNEIDHDVVVAPPVVVSQNRQSAKGKNRYPISNEEWVRMVKSPPSAIKMPLRSYIELECEALGIPAPQIYWLSGPDPLRQLDALMGNSIAEISTTPASLRAKTQSRLIIDCASPRDQGIIYCAAVSGSKTILSKPTMLLINELAKGNGSSCGPETKPRITLFSPTMMGLIGTTIALPCRASGRPEPPRTLWLDNNGQPITASSNPRHKVMGNGELVISPLVWDDIGGYTCIAQSDQGEDTATTFLYPAIDDAAGS